MQSFTAKWKLGISVTGFFARQMLFLSRNQQRHGTEKTPSTSGTVASTSLHPGPDSSEKGCCGLYATSPNAEIKLQNKT